jgi:hypothetical protein
VRSSRPSFELKEGPERRLAQRVPWINGIRHVPRPNVPIERDGLPATKVGLQITDATFAPNGTLVVAQAAPLPRIAAST